MKTVKIMLLMALAAAARGASAAPASETFVTNRIERSGREVSAALSARIADATNGIPGRIESARARAVEEATRHVADVRAEILSVANRTSEALSRATVATNEATAVGRRVDALERGLESERDARAEAVETAEAHITNHALDTTRHLTADQARELVAETLAAKNYNLETQDGLINALIDIIETLGGTASE